MGVILDLGYLLAAVIASPWLIYLLSQRRHREGFAGRLGRGLGPPLALTRRINSTHSIFIATEHL